MTRKQRRLTLIAAAGSVLALAVGLVLYAFQDTIVFFATPTEVQAKPVDPGVRLRLGGLVEEQSVVRGQGTTVSFTITDVTAAVPVVYDGTLPDLFREGQGVVAEGRFDSEGVFVADSVLAKHDESYMPREVADALKKQGVWQEQGKGE
ncbi:cytochrome c maturation protein CcmE [Tepidamorphus sp. 3E244]|uniref:cytochrome c maturation protein CcmE n=1 Tax=Tepidamorphus sp. 3E244 TaxID=3385498 RepID=UPI0038FCB42A